MTNAIANMSLALPHLAPAIPQQFTHYGRGALSAPLAIALIELGMITAADLAGREYEARLVELALTRWWNRQTAGLTLFRWSLHVQELDTYTSHEQDGWPCFCVVPIGDAPHFSLALRVEGLENELTGFGQTVLAVLEDACCYLPVAWTLREALGMASHIHWMGESDEQEVILEMIDQGEYATREAVLAEVDLFTRAQFFAGMPEWAPLPRRVCSREDIEIAASSNRSKSVIKACDAITTLVHSTGFMLQRGESALQTMHTESVLACVWLRWSIDDATERAIDDYLENASQCGEYVEFIAACKVPATKAAIASYLRKMENMLQLAALVEQLIVLIGTPAHWMEGKQ